MSCGPEGSGAARTTWSPWKPLRAPRTACSAGLALWGWLRVPCHPILPRVGQASGSQAETGSQALVLKDLRVPKAPCPLMVPENSEHSRSQPHLPEN